MLERDLWAVIKSKEACKSEARWMHCENATAIGVPDLNACINGLEFWIELKSPKLHKKPSTPFFGGSHKISSVQKAWMRLQHKAGGNAFLLASNEGHSIVLDGGMLPAALNQMTIAELSSDKSCVYYEATTLEASWDSLIEAVLKHIKGTKNGTADN